MNPLRVTVKSLITVAAVLSAPHLAMADEGGVSFWVPGFFGSMAATPQQPGFTLATIYYHTSVSAGAHVATARQITRGNITADVSANITGSLNADADLGFAIPTYVFATPVLGGQAAVALLVPFGRNRASVDATLTGTVGPFPFAVSGGRSDTVSRVRRSDPAVFSALECRRSQLHDLHHRRYAGRQL